MIHGPYNVKINTVLKNAHWRNIYINCVGMKLHQTHALSAGIHRPSTSP